jgi:hypothetical protein
MVLASVFFLDHARDLNFDFCLKMLEKDLGKIP